MRREHAVFWAASGLIALHVADDSFFQPEPGTSAGDHLVSGLIPLAVLALAAVSYPHLRAGMRATLAIFIGVVALGAGIGVSIYHSVKEGPAGDDFTGLAGALAGGALIALGIVMLWRTRRLDESRRRRYLRRALITVAGVVLGVQLAVGTALGYVYTHKARSPVTTADLGRPHEDVSFSTSDGLKLEGWYVPSRNRAAVIVFPGRGGNPKEHARMLVRHAYGALLFDNRGRGASDGDANSFGWDGENDLRAAIDFLSTRQDVDPARIGGLGPSVGGELMLQTAAHDTALRAVVSEGAGFRSYREALEAPGRDKWLTLPAIAMMNVAVGVFSNSTPPEKLHDLVGDIAPRPVFLIFATKGQGAENMSADYYEAAGEPRTVWEIPDASTSAGSTLTPRSTSGGLRSSSTARYGRRASVATRLRLALAAAQLEAAAWALPRPVAPLHLGRAAPAGFRNRLRMAANLGSARRRSSVG